MAMVREKADEARDRWHHLDRWDRIRVVVTTLLVSFLVVFVPLTIWQYARFHELPLQNLPDRISWCGRDYHRGADTTQSVSDDRVGVVFAFEFAPPLSPHHDVYVDGPIPDPRVDGEPCAVTLYVRTDSGDVTYSLEGGP